MPSPFSIIGGLFVRALLWLGVLLSIWYWQREVFALPASWLAGHAMESFFPSWVAGVEQEGNMVVLLTRITIFTEDGRMGTLTPEVRALTYCYGPPLFLALLLASRAKGIWWKFPVGLFAMLPFQAWGISFDWLVDVAVHMANLTSSVTRFTPLHANLFGLAYQLGFLLFPTLIPFLLWVYLERGFVATVAVDGAMAGMLEKNTPANR